MSIKIRIADLELLEDCPKCEGYGSRYSITVLSPESIPCERCNGRGQCLTENGVDLITFLKTYWDEVET